MWVFGGICGLTTPNGHLADILDCLIVPFKAGQIPMIGVETAI
jgi:hypothetical protein